MFGEGANGKSTFVNVVASIMGDYAGHAPQKLLVVRNHDAHPTEQVVLYRRRFIACMETSQGDRLSEALVKNLTGGDPIRTRRVKEDFWQFEPTHKFWLSTNHRPVVRGTDNAIWRRLKLIPFGVSIPEAEQDPKLSEKLLSERSGILNWMLQGVRDWLEYGLDDPPEVIDATSEYREESDFFQEFLVDCCDIQNDGRDCQAADLYESFRGWTGGGRCKSQTAFGKEMKTRGFKKRISQGRKYYVGVSLK
jgi:putative DNA primase/helicase